MRVVDRHGEHSAVDYFLTAHERIGSTKWKKCLLLLAADPVAGELVDNATPAYETAVKDTTGLTTAPLQAVGGRAVRVHWNGEDTRRSHLQCNPQALYQSARPDVTAEHPDEVRGHALRRMLVADLPETLRGVA